MSGVKETQLTARRPSIQETPTIPTNTNPKFIGKLITLYDNLSNKLFSDQDLRKVFTDLKAAAEKIEMFDLCQMRLPDTIDTSQSSRTVVHYAVEAMDMQVLNNIYELGNSTPIDLNVTDIDQKTPLMILFDFENIRTLIRSPVAQIETGILDRYMNNDYDDTQSFITDAMETEEDDNQLVSNITQLFSDPSKYSIDVHRTDTNGLTTAEHLLNAYKSMIDSPDFKSEEERRYWLDKLYIILYRYLLRCIQDEWDNNYLFKIKTKLESLVSHVSSRPEHGFVWNRLRYILTKVEERIREIGVIKMNIGKMEQKLSQESRDIFILVRSSLERHAEVVPAKRGSHHPPKPPTYYKVWALFVLFRFDFKTIDEFTYIFKIFPFEIDHYSVLLRQEPSSSEFIEDGYSILFYDDDIKRFLRSRFPIDVYLYHYYYICLQFMFKHNIFKTGTSEVNYLYAQAVLYLLIISGLYVYIDHWDNDTLIQNLRTRLEELMAHIRSDNIFVIYLFLYYRLFCSRDVKLLSGYDEFKNRILQYGFDMDSVDIDIEEFVDIHENMEREKKKDCPMLRFGVMTEHRKRQTVPSMKALWDFELSTRQYIYTNNLRMYS